MWRDELTKRQIEPGSGRRAAVKILKASEPKIKMTGAHFGPGECMSNNRRFFCDEWRTSASDKMDSTYTYVLQDMIDDESLAMISNFCKLIVIPDDPSDSEVQYKL